ncbi:Hypothetical predicted protein, partial [Paramuricea clavata]
MSHKNDLKDAAQKLSELTSEPMNSMLDKQSKADAIAKNPRKKQDGNPGCPTHNSRASPMIWTQEQDDALCKQILLIEPFRFRPRTNQSGSAWSKVSDELNKMASLQMKVDQRA